MATNTIDYSTKDYEGFRTDLINMLKTKIPTYSDFSSSDAGIVIIELLSYGLDVLSYYTDKVANELYMDTAQERESLLKLCKFLSYTPNSATSSQVYQVVNINTQSSDYTIPKGFQFCTDASNSTDKVIFESTADAVIPKGKTGLEKDTNGNYLYQIPLIQGYTITGDILGTSNNTSNQQFILNYKPVVSDSLMLYVNEGTGFRLWTKVDNFVDSDSSAKVFRVFENGDGYLVIEFGTGTSGKIPSIYNNGIMATYRVGGGTDGNVAANAISKCVNGNSVIVSTYNPQPPYVIGTDAETNDEIKVNAPASLRTIGDRAINAQDYEDIMLLRGDILMCKANPHADSITMELITLLKSSATLTTTYKQEIVDYFDDKKAFGDIVTVTSAVAHPVNVTIQITAYPSYTNSGIKSSVTDLVNQFFTVGNGNFTIGQAFTDEDLRFSIKSLGGVQKISITCTDTIASTEYITLGTATITVTGGK